MSRHFAKSSAGLSCIRSFSSSSIGRARNPPNFKSPLSSKDTKGQVFPPSPGKKFDKYFVNPRPKKAWHGQDKDEFFRKKYNYIHAERKQRDLESGATRKRTNKQSSSSRTSGTGLKENERAIRDREELRRLRRLARDRSFGSEEEKLPLFRPNPLLQYVYGTNPVLSVLRGNKRSIISKVYTSDSSSDANNQITTLAKKREIPVEFGVTKLRLNLMSNNGVHNKYIVETRPLVIPDIVGLGQYDQNEQSFSTLALQYNNTVSTTHPVNLEKKTNPLGIFIDEVSDPHNFGAILRSAYYLGADFVVYAEKNCASPSPVVAKTSAGMLDQVLMFNSPKPLQFFEKSIEQGWNIIGTVAKSVQSERGVIPSELRLLLEEKPCLLVLGSEGEGLRKSLLDRCTHLVSLKGSQDSKVLDSLNVSVASAVLLTKFYDTDVFDY
jgi:21S rRNA (GM2251-2'-O)-methyltransferase